ncbi:MAG: metallophosphoesterase [Magnetococcales bacterium]|nr:metallophosphoesterase [Magnetococcales bacterium]
MKFIKKIKRLLSNCHDNGELVTHGERDFTATCLRLPVSGAAYIFRLGGQNGKILHLYPLTADTDATPTHPSWILIDPERFFNEMGGFIRIEAGTQQVIGRHSEEQRIAFQLPPWVANRHIILEHEGDHLFVQDLKTDTGSHLTILQDKPSIERMAIWRNARLEQIQQIHGGPLLPLAPDEALDRLQRAHRILRDTWMPDSDQPAPAIVYLSAQSIPILIGDLHEHIDNLLTLLTTGGCLHALQRGHAKLIFLGDAVHPDEGKNLAEMTDSLLMMDLIFSLMIQFPGRVLYIRGNHDSCDEEISKQGISQGKAWQTTLVRSRGEVYHQAMMAFYQDLPYIAIHPWVVACHAAPFVVKVNREMLATLRNYPGLLRQLIWNRIHRPNRPGGYRARDVRLFLQTLGGPVEPPLVVGHTPLDDHHTLWMNVGGIDNHHILYGGYAKRIGWITFLDGVLTAQEYPVQPLLKQIAGRQETLPDA